nr:hypothetical protein [Haliscomenobacter sp.]
MVFELPAKRVRQPYGLSGVLYALFIGLPFPFLVENLAAPNGRY